MSDDLYDEALKYREISRELHLALGKYPCQCIETDEYKAFQAEEWERRKPMSREQRWLDAIFGEQFQGEQFAYECSRCKAMWMYEQAIGDDARDIELIARLEQWKENGEQDTK